MSNPSILQTIVPAEAAKVHIIFVHGLDGDWLKTWRAPDLPPVDTHGWPSWLAEDLGSDYAVHAYDYPACASGWKGDTLPMFDRAGDFLEELDLKLRGSSRLFFICHSLGGLIVKKLLSIARDKTGTKKQMLDRTGGVLFLGTPHQGSGVANIVNTILPKIFTRASVTLQELERTNAELRPLNETFKHLAAEHAWNVFQFAEGKDTFKVRIVDEHSANSGVGDCVVVDEDHISLPKPASRASKVLQRALVMLRALQPDAAAASGQGAGLPPGPDAPPDIYAATSAEVEKLVKASSAVRDFFARHVPGLFVTDSAGLHLCQEATRPGFDLCPHFENVRDNIGEFAGARGDLDAMEKVLGGLLILSVNPVWLHGQSTAKTQDTVRFPARLDWMPLGGGNRANMLHLVASALADGFARLSKLFGDPPGQADDRCLPPIPEEMGGITQPDRHVLLKVHFARSVLGDNAAPNPANTNDVNLAFEQARTRMRRERLRERQPFWASDGSYLRHKETIRGEDGLGLLEFFILHPSGTDSEDRLLARSMDVLCELHHIFTALKARHAALPA